ncbi:hypothetical protein ABO04_11575 [Nitrosomonas sp. HPC101]|uniref:hypothetical protein n=1 Tax=Nitrosomonas sp. HPC101 TaxID=1658667 RepID=UPI00136E553B|nr:hypothetical protein [Nitrosomonas sp. HPC101]MXS86509.1 hypothetical protein [Nitrosomonas sp. HPC101]
MPDTDKIIELALWRNVCSEWPTTGREPKRINELYPTKAITHVAEIMKVMEEEQQYLEARLADQVAKLTDKVDGDDKQQNVATRTKKQIRINFYIPSYEEPIS